jgi:hypothetical protein
VWLVAALAAAFVVACSGPKKRHVTKDEFQPVVDYVDRNMRAPNVTGEDRKKYVISQLGPPHRSQGELLYWYTTVLDCYYFQVGEDGWASWGIGQTGDCKTYGIAK